MYSSASETVNGAMRIGAAIAGSSSLADAFNRAKLDLFKAINRFTARYKRLPELEAQVRAIGVYALKAPARSPAKKQFVAEYAKATHDVEQLKAQAELVRSKSAEAMAEVRRLATELGIGVGTISGVLVPVVILVAGAAAIKWSFTFDKRAANNAKVLELGAKQNWSAREIADVADAMSRESAIPDPRRLKDFLGTMSSGLVVGALAVIFLPQILRMYRSRRMRRAA